MARVKQKQQHMDPFEAAKVSAESLGMPDLTESSPVFAPDPVYATAPDFAAPVEPVVAPAEPAPAPVSKAAQKAAKAEDAIVVVAAPAQKLKRYLVQRRTTVMWRGQMITLQPDDNIGPQFYGAGSVEYFRTAGVPFVEVD